MESLIQQSPIKVVNGMDLKTSRTDLDTTDLVNGASMFANSSLETVPPLCLSNLVNGSGMFAFSQGLTTVDGTNFGFESLENAQYMFGQCCALKTIKGSGNWDMSHATDLRTMFENCFALTSLDASHWNLPITVTTERMFDACYSMTKLTINRKALESLIRTGAVAGTTLVDGIATYHVHFDGVEGLIIDSVAEEVPVVQDMPTSEQRQLAVYARPPIEVVNGRGILASSSVRGLSHYDFTGCINAVGMFDSCSQLTHVTLEMPYLTVGRSMFGSCTSLVYLNLTLGPVANLNSLCDQCYALEEVHIRIPDASALTTVKSMFETAVALKTVDLGGWNTTSLTNTYHMLQDAADGLMVDLSGWTFDALTVSTSMFPERNFKLRVSEKAADKLVALGVIRQGASRAPPDTNGYYSVVYYEDSGLWFDEVTEVAPDSDSPSE